MIKLPIDLPALLHALMQRSSGKVDSPTFARRVRVESLTLNTTILLFLSAAAVDAAAVFLVADIFFSGVLVLKRAVVLVLSS